MAELNHTIVHSKDPERSASFMAAVLGLDPPSSYGPFLVVEAGNRVSLDFLVTDGEVTPQHYAFLVSDDEFDATFGRIKERGLEYWAYPGHRGPGEINRRDDGRGLYFDDPDGHALEILTRPYGSGSK